MAKSTDFDKLLAQSMEELRLRTETGRKRGRS
jgi:hypothetical protein